jgi:hypothetical protein
VDASVDVEESVDVDDSDDGLRHDPDDRDADDTKMERTLTILEAERRE